MQRAFVADASHELRTPLTVLDARLQLLQRGLEADNPSTPTVIELRHDAATLIGIVNDLLALALAEVDRSPTTGESIALTPVVQRAVASMSMLAAQRSVSIRPDAAEHSVTAVPATSIHRCLLSLLDNALDFSPAGSTIDVTVEELTTTVLIRVRDHGPGITGIDPSRIFDRFARGRRRWWLWKDPYRIRHRTLVRARYRGSFGRHRECRNDFAVRDCYRIADSPGASAASVRWPREL